MMYKRFLEIPGTLETVEDLNKAIEAMTDIPEFFDTENEGWRAWVEYEDGNTFILEEDAQ